MSKFGRDILRDVEGYTPGEQPRDGIYIKLNTNENPYPTSPKVIEALQSVSTEHLRKYPDPVAGALRRACAERYGVPGEEWIIAGNGMDEILALAIRAFVDPGDKLITVYPTYTLYDVLCQLHGCSLRAIPLDDDFQLSPDFFNEQGTLCFLTRPNAPTGIAYPKEEIENFCKSFKGIVLIDEAYVDFADDNCMDLPLQYDNVIVTRTFSKSYALAGLRIGVAVAQPALINEFIKIKDSYNMNYLSQKAALAAIQDNAYMEMRSEQIRKSRTQLRRQLLDLGFSVPESKSNFLLARWDGTPSAAVLFETLRNHHILVRYFNQPRLDNALRITVGTDEECDQLIQALKTIIAS